MSFHGSATNKEEKSSLSWLFMYQVTRFEISYRQTSVHIEADAKFTLIENYDCDAERPPK
jgi:hypothetical protein